MKSKNLRWRIRSTDEIDEDTGRPLEWSNESGWISGYGDEFDSRDGLHLPIGGEWVMVAAEGSHTPGPWTIEWSDEDCQDGVSIESHEGPIAFRVLECDAHLISTAPELLAALKDLMELYSNGQLVIEGERDEGDDPVVGAAFSAIAKAEGRE